MNQASYKWLVLMYSLPTNAGSARVRIWRKLKKLGMVSFHNSGYFLPYSEEHYEITQWLAQEIQKAGGEVTLLKTQSVENHTDEQMSRFFRRERGEEYSQVSQAAAKLHARLSALETARGRAGADIGAAGMIELVEELKGLEKRLAEIGEIDFFDAPGRRQAEEAIGLCRKDVRGLQKQEELPGETRLSLDPADFQGKVWVTRPRPFVDRIATAWVIRRFIDPQARIKFAGEASSAKDAVPFDYVEADISHQGEDCTLETLIKSFGLKGKAIDGVAEIVHDVDLRDAKFNRREAAGLDLVLKGLVSSIPDDTALLKQGLTLFDALYSGLGGDLPKPPRAGGRKHKSIV